MRQCIRLMGVRSGIEGRAWQGFDLLRIGRERYWEVQLGDSSISRCHAELTFVRAHGWFVRDLGSTNGTYMSTDEAFEELQRGAGVQFDPECSQAFLGLRHRLGKMVPPGRPAEAVAIEPVLAEAPAEFDTECALV